ncbi:hypothetical protein J8I29_00065 [Labrys sp. LIt4]|uniref:L,D-transpeptidase family protein n=1 Tax=Labrys sp. LIt4 TaxID=2821355 RepID=UPI001AE0E3CE|nr:L,D-transpeptidase family protein [Labrys sp. LIt4]MBP0577688.1 hypothetical protein [Labrys sp. LIt4]
MKRKIDLIRVQASPLSRSRGRLTVGGVSYPCVLGRSGVAATKREGDGVTPRAALPLRGLFQRLDRAPRIPSQLPFRAIRPQDAWCDDVCDRRYNTLIQRPLDQNAEERLARGDRLYDVIVPLGWNDAPIVKGRGSAIFWHVSRENNAPTAGCVAVTPAVFRKVLPRLSRHAVMIID